jgi:peptide/nickel transport system substrate-binding protein
MGVSDSDIQNLDPQLGGTVSVEGPVMRMLYSGLVRYPVGTLDFADIEGDLAETWERSEDGLEWTFYLREGVMFHKSYGEFTAEDVKFSLDRNLVEGSPWRGDFEVVDRIEVVDKYVVKIVLKRVDPFFLLRVLGYHGGWITSKKAVEELGDVRLNPVGTGPFYLEDYKPRESITLARNEDYFRGIPILEKVTVFFMPDTSSRELAIRKGDLDVIIGEDDPAWINKIESQTDLVVFGMDPGLPYFLYLNTAHEPLDNINVRKALQHATDKDGFLIVRQGVKLVSPVPPGYFGYTEDVPRYEYDLEKARSLLAQAGFADGINIHIVNSEAAGYVQLIQIVQAQWAEAGIDVELEIVDHASWHTMIRQDKSDVVIYSFVRLPIADTVLFQFFHSSSTVGTPTGITNFSHYDRIDSLIEAARETTDAEEQQAIYAEAQRTIMEDAVCIPLFKSRWPIITRQPYVDFAQPEPSGTLIYFPTVYENTRILEH